MWKKSDETEAEEYGDGTEGGRGGGGVAGGQGAEKVDAAKQARLVAAARRLIAERHIDCEVQFDIVAVVLDGEEPQVEYIPEAFYPIFY